MGYWWLCSELLSRELLAEVRGSIVVGERGGDWTGCECQAWGSRSKLTLHNIVV